MKWVLLILALKAVNCPAQDSSVTNAKWKLSGYIKSLESISFDKQFKNVVSFNQVHNRINIKWVTSDKISVIAEFRNRLVWGEEVKLTHRFAALMKNSNEKFDLQKAWITNPSLILHSNVERLYLNFNSSKTGIRLGRQRINWGVTTTWNPNDIFNAYNFLDFDYEERPGADGIKLQHHFKNASNAEFAWVSTGLKNGDIAAFKYWFNTSGYDFQFITGIFKRHITLGTGWAGSIKGAGFKGEAQYFFRHNDSSGHISLAAEADYLFKKGWYINGGILVNSRGLIKPVNNLEEINLKLSPDNLMPTRWNVLITAAKEIDPLFSVNTTLVYAPGTNLVILLPSVQYNIATNLDVNLVWQSFFAEINKKFQAISHRSFLRFKWSF